MYLTQRGQRFREKSRYDAFVEVSTSRTVDSERGFLINAT